jgi:ABC-type glutathione transport system ATPase component
MDATDSTPDPAGEQVQAQAQAQEQATQAADAQPLLRLTNVGKNFGPVRVLMDIDLDIPPGLVTAVVGDNGAGKSTLIKTISGIYQPDGGEIRWQGRQVHLHAPKDATDLGIATVYQDLALCDNLRRPSSASSTRSAWRKPLSRRWPISPWSRSARSASRWGRCPVASGKPSRSPGP